MTPPDNFETNSLAGAALAYAVRGWHVLPLWWPASTGHCACGLPDCDSMGKHRIHRLVPHGLHHATSHAPVVIWVVAVGPHANISVRTGAGSGPVALDIDGQPGRVALRALVESHAAFGADWVRAGDGWHANFANSGAIVPNSSGRPGPGLDVRGNGGYVIAPPSLHGSGRRYRWISPQNADLPPAPAWLLEATPAAAALLAAGLAAGPGERKIRSTGSPRTPGRDAPSAPPPA
jgi:Bifunctional DNA primase/polymerase, N-terminal